MQQPTPLWKREIGHIELGSWMVMGLALILTARHLSADSWGLDHDTPTLVNSARSILAGDYHISRFPGHPLAEFIYAPFSWASPGVMSALALLPWLTSLYLTARLAQVLRIEGAYWVVAAVAFVPGISVYALSVNDFIWVLPLVLASLLGLLLGRSYFTQGLLIGLAAGARTEVLIVVPIILGWLVWKRKKNFPPALRWLIGCGTGAFLVFLPVLIWQGEMPAFGFGGRPGADRILKYLLLSDWGIGGLLVWIPTLVLLGINYHEWGERWNKAKTLLACVVLAVYVAFLNSPFDPSYKIVALPLVMLLVFQGITLSQRRVLGLCFALAGASLGTASNEYFYYKPQPVKRLFRHNYENLTKTLALYLQGQPALERIKKSQEKRLALSLDTLASEQKRAFVGYLLTPKIRLYQPEPSYPLYFELERLEKLQALVRSGYQVVYLPGAAKANAQHYGFDPLEYGAVELSQIDTSIVYGKPMTTPSEPRVY